VKQSKREGFLRGVDFKHDEFSETEADDFVIGDLR
jgi:GDP-D-mannose 3',5'-epimerase